MLVYATACGVDKGNILYLELETTMERVKNLRNDIRLFESLTVRTYVEAKHLFARLLKLGIWIDEAKIIQKIVGINASVEEILVQNDSERIAIELTNLIKNHSELIDNGLKADIKIKQNKMITV